MYKRASKFFQRNKGLLVTTGKTGRKRKRKRKHNNSKTNIDRLKLKLIKLFPQKFFCFFCKYNFDSVKVILYKSEQSAEHSDILVVVNPGPLRTLSKRHKKLLWNPLGTDKISIAKFLKDKGFSYKAVLDFLDSAKKKAGENISLSSKE